MMRMKTKLSGLSPLGTAAGAPVAGAGADPDAGDWEIRPGGLLVQKRCDSDQNAAPPPTIMVRVKHGSIYHEISISSQATFGELKKKLTVVTGLHHEDQKLMFKDKPRDSKAYLDLCGVKDKSKLVVMEDPISQEKRWLEMRRNAKMDKAAKSISDISLEVDSLAAKVSALESVISKGGKVPEKELTDVTELLMNEVIKLDAIVADGDVKLQRKIQVKRVQKYVETLDLLKIKNSQSPTPNQERRSGLPPSGRQRQQRPPRNSTSETVVTTQWETFDSNPPPPPSNNNRKSTWDLLG